MTETSSIVAALRLPQRAFINSMDSRSVGPLASGCLPLDSRESRYVLGRTQNSESGARKGPALKAGQTAVSSSEFVEKVIFR